MTSSMYINEVFKSLNEFNVAWGDRYVLLVLESAFDTYLEYNDMVANIEYGDESFLTFYDVFENIKDKLNIHEDIELSRILNSLKKKKYIDFVNNLTEGIIYFEIIALNRKYQKTDYDNLRNERKAEKKLRREKEKLLKLQRKQSQEKTKLL